MSMLQRIQNPGRHFLLAMSALVLLLAPLGCKKSTDGVDAKKPPIVKAKKPGKGVDLAGAATPSAGKGDDKIAGKAVRQPEGATPTAGTPPAVPAPQRGRPPEPGKPAEAGKAGAMPHSTVVTNPMQPPPVLAKAPEPVKPPEPPKEIILATPPPGKELAKPAHAEAPKRAETPKRAEAPADAEKIAKADDAPRPIVPQVANPDGTVTVRAAPTEPPLDINGYLSRADVEKVLGPKQKFLRADLVGVNPSPNYNSVFFATEKTDLFGVAVQVWRDPNLAESRTRFNTMKNSYSNVAPTTKVTDMGFRSYYGNVVTLVFVDPRRPLLAGVSCSTKLCTADQLIELARRVAERLR